MKLPQLYECGTTRKTRQILQTLQDISTALNQAITSLEEQQYEIKELQDTVNAYEPHVCEPNLYNLAPVLRPDKFGRKEEINPRIYSSKDRPPPTCHWCKEPVGVAYRGNQQYLLRCPCRVTYLKANSIIDAVNKLRL